MNSLGEENHKESKISGGRLAGTNHVEDSERGSPHCAMEKATSLMSPTAKYLKGFR